MLRVVLSRIAGLFRHQTADDRLSEEIQTHLAYLAAELERTGLSPAQARLAARREFGGALHMREIHRDQRSLPLLDEFAQDLRYAARQFIANPGFSAAVILTLALGIGANTAIFRVFDAVVLRSLPVPNPEQLVVLDTFRGATNIGFTYPIFHEIAARQQVLSSLAAVAFLPLETCEVSPGEPIEGVTAHLVSSDYFAILGVSPQFGRLLDSRDDSPSAPLTAVISDSFRRRTFEASPAAIGRTIHINGARFVISGITPPGFFGETIGRAPDIWTPLARAADVNGGMIIHRSSKVISVMGRLRPGVGPVAAEEALASLYAQFEESYGQTLVGVSGTYRIAFSPGAQGLRGMRTHFAQPLWVLMAIVGVVLVMACCNLANLLMARATARTHEIGVRLALGASRRRLFRQLLTESLMLSLAGSGLGLALAVWGSRRLIQLAATGEPWRVNMDFGWRILGFAGAVSMLAVCLFGLVPAIAATRVAVSSALQASRSTLAGSRTRSALSKCLVVAQIALSLLLVSSATLLVRSFWNLLHQDFGYHPAGVLLVNVPLSEIGTSLSKTAGRVQVLAERLQSLPGVRSLSLDTTGPLSQWQMTVSYSTADRPPQPTDNARRASVSGSYFSTLGVPILAGRAITAADCQSKARVAVLSETAARKLFGRANPIGQLISEDNQFDADKAIQVIGVARDVRPLNPRDPIGALVYEPQTHGPVTGIEIRTDGDPASLVGPVRRLLDEAAGLRSAEVRPLGDAMRSQVGQDRLMAVLSGAFGILALLLASVGLYGVIAYTVERRTQEIGIRVALGATRSQICAFLMREASLLILAGLAIGGAATLLAAQWLRTLLFGIVPHDPAMLSAAAILLTLVALAAAFIPTRRAARLDPTQALRRE